MKLSPENVVVAARAYIGTPWHHCGRIKQVGIDCAGLLVLVSRDLKVEVQDDTSYSLGDEYERMLKTIKQHCAELKHKREALQPGDILVFRSRQMLNHCGIYNGEGGMIHAYNSPSVNKVVEHSLDDSWWRRLAGVYRYKAFVE